jgi:hypothetical protein
MRAERIVEASTRGGRRLRVGHDCQSRASNKQQSAYRKARGPNGNKGRREQKTGRWGALDRHDCFRPSSGAWAAGFDIDFHPTTFVLFFLRKSFRYSPCRAWARRSGAREQGRRAGTATLWFRLMIDALAQAPPCPDGTTHTRGFPPPQWNLSRGFWHVCLLRTCCAPEICNGWLVDGEPLASRGRRKLGNTTLDFGTGVSTNRMQGIQCWKPVFTKPHIFGSCHFFAELADLNRGGPWLANAADPLPWRETSAFLLRVADAVSGVSASQRFCPAVMRLQPLRCGLL